MKPSEEIAALEQNAQAKIQFWNAMRKIIPATGTIATDMGQRNEYCY
jgi:flagellar motor component MotA